MKTFMLRETSCQVPIWQCYTERFPVNIKTTVRVTASFFFFEGVSQETLELIGSVSDTVWGAGTVERGHSHFSRHSQSTTGQTSPRWEEFTSQKTSPQHCVWLCWQQTVFGPANAVRSVLVSAKWRLDLVIKSSPQNKRHAWLAV